MWKNLGAIALFELALFLVFLTSFRTSTDEPAHMTFLNLTEPQTLDPAKMTGQPEGRIAQGIFEGLTVYHPKTLEPLPGMAESWDISPDGRVITFKIREGSYWVQGQEKVREVDAHDFVYSWRRVLAPEVASQYDFLLRDYVEGAQEYKDLQIKRNEVFLKKWSARADELGYVGGTIKTVADVVKLGDEGEEAYAAFQALRLDDFKAVGIAAPDARTFKVTLKSATPYFTDLTCFYALYPVDRECVEGNPNTWMRPENIVTNGPFYLESWRFNEKIRMRRNEHYWDTENVGMESIDALAVEEYTTALNIYLKGGADWVTTAPSQLIPKLEDREDYHRNAYLSIYYYLVNTEREVFQGERGKKVRQALSIAIDRASLVKNVTQAGQQPAYNLVPPGVPGYPGAKGLSFETREESVNRARKLLSEAGYPDGKGFPKVILLYNTSEDHKKVAAAIQNYWKRDLGIDIELKNQEWGTYLDSRRNKAFDIARAGWIGDYTDPNTFLDLLISDSPQNNTGFNDPYYDGLLKYARDIPGVLGDDERRAKFLKDLPQLEDEVKAFLAEQNANLRFKKASAIRLKVLLEADEIIADELPVIPIYFYTSNELWPSDLEGLYDNLRDTHMPKFWRWKKGSPRYRPRK